MNILTEISPSGRKYLISAHALCSWNTCCAPSFACSAFQDSSYAWLPITQPSCISIWEAIYPPCCLSRWPKWSEVTSCLWCGLYFNSPRLVWKLVRISTKTSQWWAHGLLGLFSKSNSHVVCVLQEHWWKKKCIQHCAILFVNTFKRLLSFVCGEFTKRVVLKMQTTCKCGGDCVCAIWCCACWIKLAFKKSKTLTQ